MLGTGTALYVADHQKRDEFEMYVLSDYARTNEEHREVLEAFLGTRHAEWRQFAFDILAAEGLIERPLAERMKAMVGFRNIAVHDYQQLQIAILQRVVEERLQDLKTLGSVLLQTRGQSGPVG